MGNIKVKKISALLLSLMLTTFTLSGCSKKSDCEIPSRHVHLYTKDINGTNISKYLDSEKLEIDGYNWNPDYITITKEDEAFYKAMDKLFYGSDNWDYLYNVMKNNSQDYLTFYYSYTTTTVETTTDSKGNTQTRIKNQSHTGWSTSPTHQGVTGDVRVNHHQFYGYRIINKDGKYVKERSPLADDFRDIINEYPLFSEYDSSLLFDDGCVDVVYHKYKFPVSELRNLKASDFDDFTGPDLENKELYTK